MNNKTNIDWFNDLFKTYGYSESDIISMYIDGKISKDEYVRRMDDVRGNKVR
jgi:hypothetical protein